MKKGKIRMVVGISEVDHPYFGIYYSHTTERERERERESGEREREAKQSNLSNLSTFLAMFLTLR